MAEATTDGKSVSPARRIVTVYANVRITLKRSAARRALRKVLDAARERTGALPDVVALGEWGRSRAGILRGLRDYRWKRPLRGGGPVGLLRTRFRDLHCEAVKLVGRTRVEPDEGNPRTHLGPSWCTQVTAVDKATGQKHAWLNYHLTAGIQDRHGHYKRRTHPRRVSRHEHEVRALEHRIRTLQADGYRVTALGDSNFDGLQLHGLESAQPPADLGKRHVSDVFGPGQAHTFAVHTASDHRAIVAVRN